MKKPKKAKQAPDNSRFAAEQYDLMCKALEVSPLGSAPGSTPWEALCVLRMKLDVAQDYLAGFPNSPEAKDVLEFLKAPHDSMTFATIKLYQ